MAVDVGARSGSLGDPGTAAAPRALDNAPLLLAGIVVLGAAIRFSTLNEQSFWYDEAATYAIVAHGLGHVFATVPKTESTPPLYYVLLWLWSRVFGIGEMGLRSFSALCGTATIVVMWAIGRRMGSERVGLVAALLTATNPFLFWYSQEARSYALLVLVSTVSLLALLRALEAPSRRRLLIWGIVAAIALNVHYFAIFALVGEGAWLLIVLYRRGLLTWERAALTCVPAVVVAIPLGLLAIHQNDGRAGYIADDSGSLGYRLAQLIKQDIIGDGQPHKTLLGLVGSLLVLMALGLLIRRGTRAERSAALLPGVIATAGVLLAIIVAAAGTDYFNTRNMLAVWPALGLVVAAGFGARRAGWLGATGACALSLLCLFCVWNVVDDPAFQRDDWRGAARALGPAATPRAIVANRYEGLPTLQVYLRGVSRYPARGMTVREVDVIWLGRGSFGHAILPFAPVALPGFTSRVIRSPTYTVVRYRADRAVFEPASTLDGIYPSAGNGFVLRES